MLSLWLQSKYQRWCQHKNRNVLLLIDTVNKSNRGASLCLTFYYRWLYMSVQHNIRHLGCKQTTKPIRDALMEERLDLNLWITACISVSLSYVHTTWKELHVKYVDVVSEAGMSVVCGVFNCCCLKAAVSLGRVELSTGSERSWIFFQLGFCEVEGHVAAGS